MSKQSGYCERCNQHVSISGRSDANLRTHLANNHDMPEVLCPSQKARKRSGKENKITIDEKRKYDDELVNCIISATFFKNP